MDCEKNTHAMALVDPYVVCEKNTHAMTPGVVSKKNTHEMTLVDPPVSALIGCGRPSPSMVVRIMAPLENILLITNGLSYVGVHFSLGITLW